MLSSPKKPKYQVVLEFHGDHSDNLERVIALESKLDEELDCGEVDGNDVGQGVINIFIITAEPNRCFEEAMRIVKGGANTLFDPEVAHLFSVSSPPH